MAGTKSGRDVNKIELLGLHIVQPEIISVPGIQELPLTLECSVIYSQLQDRERIPQQIKEDFYPAELDYTNPGRNRDYHIAFYGKIEAAYIIGD